MSYAPSTFHAGTGEDFFRKEGFLVDGMDPLVTARYTIPTPSDSNGTAITITNSVGQAASGASDATWIGYNLAAGKTKLLAIKYGQYKSGTWMGLGFHTSTLPTTTLQNAYMALYVGAGSKTALAKYVGGTYSAIVTEDTTFYQDNAQVAPVMGIGLYVDGDNDIQKSFVQSGTGEWFQLQAGAADSHSSFQSFFMLSSGAYSRHIAPIYCWGS
jgi:hypothetical protein